MKIRTSVTRSDYMIISHNSQTVSKCILGLKYKNILQLEISLNLESICSVEIHLFGVSEKNITVELRDRLRMPLRNVS